MIVYITRPYAYEVYMGGKRDVRLWVQEPYYSHHSIGNELGGEIRYVDQGWHATHSGSVKARFILTQDNTLLEKVWKEIFWSILPKGMSYDEGCVWADIVTSEDPEFPDTNYRLLVDDKEWEGKCNVCHKRFLLKVNLRTNEVERIKPGVYLRRRSAEERDLGFIHTDEASVLDATEYWHPECGIDDIPF